MALNFLGNKSKDEKTEMSFLDHLDVLRKYLFRSAVAIAIGMLIAGIYNKFIMDSIVLGPMHKDFISFRKLCEWGQQLGLGNSMCTSTISINMQNTNTTGQISMFFTVLFVAGLVIAFPYIFWQFWLFIRPALTKKELNKTRGVIFWVSFLFFTGILFGYFFLVPISMNFLANFSLSDKIQNIWTIESYIGTVMPFILGTGLAFQLPLVIYFLAHIGVVSTKFLRTNRKYAVLIIVIVAGIITPPEVISQIVVTLPLLLLYEISILLTRNVEKKKAKEEIKEWS